jgi:hypothetical protein
LALEEREESGHGAVAVADDGEGLRSLGPPALELRGRLRALVPARDRADGVGVALARGLDGQRLRAAREEGLTHDRVVDQVEHVGGVAPELGGRRIPRFGAELAPGGPLVRAVAAGIRAVEEAGDCVSHGLVHDETVAAGVDEREIEQPTQGLGAVVFVEHRGQQGLGRPAHDRGGLERPSRKLVLHVLQIAVRQLLHDAGHRRILERELGTLGHASRGERQRERMPAGDSVQARSLARCRSELREHRERVGLVERAERQRPEAVEREPAGDGPLASAEH